MKSFILVIEDEKPMALTLSTLLGKDYRVEVAFTGLEGVKIAVTGEPDLVLLDLNLPDASGIDVLKQLHAMEPSPEVIIITAVRELKTAVEAMKLGAFDYIEKPFEREELLLTISKALERQQLGREVYALRSEVADAYGHDTLVGNSEGMQKIQEFIDRVKDQDCNVLILGESGTGKELVARAIHYTGQRKYGPFIPLNCACLSQTMLESELFGHEKGAFTGAEKKRRGKIELANSGTLFLDEISSMELGVQAKLLRVIEFKEFERLGAEVALKSDFRLISASNTSLGEETKVDNFREDLFYRLNVTSIEIPPLRKRRSDIAFLIEHFLNRYYKKTGKLIKGISDSAMNKLISYEWPGNVRQLQNVLENAIIMEDKEILSEKYLIGSQLIEKNNEPKTAKEENSQLQDAIGVFEARLVKNALEKCSWNKQKAADFLGVHINTLKNKMSKYSISAPR